MLSVRNQQNKKVHFKENIMMKPDSKSYKTQACNSSRIMKETLKVNTMVTNMSTNISR